MIDKISSLISMGYRPLDKQETIWAKPVGHGIFTFDFKDSNCSFWFRDYTTGEMALWAREPYVNENYNGTLVFWLAYFENYNFKCFNRQGNFEFLTDKDKEQDILRWTE